MQYLQFYTKISTNPELLANGHTLITNYLLQSPQNRQITLTNILTPSPPILVLIGNVYPRDVYPLLDQNQKIQTRVFLLQILFEKIKETGVKNKSVLGLLSMVRKIHNQEGYDKWLLLYAQLIKNIPIQHFAQFVILLLEEADNRISTLSINVFNFIMQSIQSHQNSVQFPISTQNLLQIFYHSIKSFAHLQGTDDATLEKLFYPYKKWLKLFVWKNIQNNPICMKYSLKLLMILYSDMGFAQDEQEENIRKFQQFGVQLTQEYLKIGAQGGCEVYIKQQDQIQEDEQYDINELNSAQTFKKNLPIIIYQVLEVYDFLIQSEVEVNTDKILLICILLATPSKNSVGHWTKNTDDYLINIQQQFQKTIRNRSNSIITTLLEQHQQRQNHCEIMRQYFGVVAEALMKGGNLSLLEAYINNKINAQIKLFDSQFLAYEEASYFILASVIETLYKQNTRKQLIAYLINRCKNVDNTSNCVGNILLKISITFICISQLNKPFDQNIVNFINFMVNQDRSVYQNMGSAGKEKETIGLALILSRGLGKLCYNQQVLIYTEAPGDIPIQFIQILISFLKISAKPDEDNSHIILQLLLKLLQISPINKQMLQKNGFIDQDLQIYMYHNFMYDGLLSVIVRKILIECPCQAVVNYLAELLLSGGVMVQYLSEIIVGWLKNGVLSFGTHHIQALLQKYSNNRRSIISSIIKLYLETLGKDKNQMTPLIQSLLSQNPDQTWLVLMLKSETLGNIPKVLLSCLYKITYQYTSKGQIQNKMVLPYYLGINNPSDFLQILKNPQSLNIKEIQKPNELCKDFLQKIHRYSKIFEGNVLKLISSVFWIKISQTQMNLDNDSGRYLIYKTVELIEGYGKVQINEWEDEELENQEQEQDLQKYLKFDIHNEQLQKQLEEIFKQNIWIWNEEFIKAKLQIFKHYLSGNKIK